jgi:hypothetical protein
MGLFQKLWFTSTEGEGLTSLGFNSRAIERFRECVEIAERLVAQEPGRTDSLGSLAVSYNKIGNLLQCMGHGEIARQFFQKALEMLSDWWPGSPVAPICESISPSLWHAR